MSDRSARVVCRATRGERLAYLAVAVVIAAFAASMAPSSPVVAVVAGVIAIAIAVMAATGRCASSWVHPAEHSPTSVRLLKGQIDSVPLPEKERSSDG
ncbi:hypothetical protein [Microbacterium sp. WCS2018Hpa-9]|uniref:hypothetical protein n=1 Tax=Microbacterium sp. WCS2018Hpa-9 TaxID=3073635 RepID=UPI00288A9FA5|nr:hypothetical protein [Microbacterium sp. WCS2018Hpa-9]